MAGIVTLATRGSGARGEASHRPQAGVGDVAIDSALAKNPPRANNVAFDGRVSQVEP